MLILIGLLTSLLINILLFAYAFKKQTDKLTDFSYSLSFIGVTLYALFWGNNDSKLFLLMVLAVFAWALRLGVFLVLRIRKQGKDSRFDGVREDFVKFIKFWLGQAVVVWLLLLPLLILSDKENTKLGVWSVIGLSIFVVALVIETVADIQKYRFRLNPENKNKWIDSGLWKYSRHPNYFGEILVWVGLFVAAMPTMNGYEVWAALLSPLAISVTLLFLSGVPPLEKYADKKWGTNSHYLAYKRRTSILIPLWPKK